jgi:hypothetical protein
MAPNWQKTGGGTVKGSKQDARLKLVELAAEEYNNIVASLGHKSGWPPSRELGGDDVLKAALFSKENGELPYYLARLMAYYMIDGGEMPSVVESEPEIRWLIKDQQNKISDNIVDKPQRIELYKKAYRTGFHNEMKYKGCAQCTLLTMFELFGRRNDILFQSASALAAGMALSGDGACGGYTGGILYMGSIIGRRLSCLEDGDKKAKELSYAMAQALHDRFLSVYGSVICKDIHKNIFGRSFCLRSPGMKDEFEKAGAHTTKCTGVIGTVSAWLAEIICDYGYGNENDENV